MFFLTIVDKLTFEGIKQDFFYLKYYFHRIQDSKQCEYSNHNLFIFLMKPILYQKLCKLKSVYFFCKHSVIVQCKCLKKLIQFSEYSLIKFRETTLSKITFRRLILCYPNKHLCCIQQIFYIWKVCFTCSIKGNEESTVPRYITEQQFVNLVTITS